MKILHELSRLNLVILLEISYNMQVLLEHKKKEKTKKEIAKYPYLYYSSI